MAELEIKLLTVGMGYTNCYLVKNKDNNEGFIVDPGEDAHKIAGHINTMNMKPKAILLTHCHYDHILAVDELREKYNIKVYISKEDAKGLIDPKINLTLKHGFPTTVNADVKLEDGEEINIAGIDIKFILTPGHTPGSGCYYVEDTNLLFSGDTMFRASRGRTDFPGGSEVEILKSIKNKLLTLPDNTYVCPGHMETTLISNEKIYYPF